MAELPEVQQSTSSKVSKTCKSPSMKLDMLFLRRLWRLIPVLFLSWRSAQALLFLLLLIVAGGEQGAAYYVGLIPSQFYIVLPAQDWYGFITTLWQSLLYIVLIALIKSTKTYISSLLYVRWRESLTTYLHRFYFKACNYYKLNVLQIGDIDNTDQRICQDVERLCDRLNQVVPVMVVAPFTIITYTILTYKITGYLGPLVIYCYFITGSIINRFIMSPVIQLTYQREKWEGIFRFKHAQLRANSESVAFYSAGEAEKQNSDKKLFDMLAVQLRLANWKFWLQVAVNLFDYIGSILSYVIIAIPIFAGVYSDLPASEISSLISAYSFQTMYLISSFSKVIDLSNSITEIAGYTHRIGELMESLEDMTPDKDQEEVSKPSDLATSSLTTFPPYHPVDALPSNISTDNQLLISEMERDREYMSEEAMVGEGEGATTAVEEEEGGENGGVVDSVIAFHLEQVNVVAPSSKDILVEDLTLEISEGCSTLITGATGSGKTSLLRVLHGLWPVVSGRLERQGVGARDIMFLPQKAYLTDGSLLEQIIYPDMISSRRRLPLDLDARVAKILDKVGLESLIQRCEGLNTTVTWNWYDVLTPGEAQCLAFARLLFHKPKFALLDEATSAVPVDKEARLYSLCHAAKMTVVSVGHHVSLKRFHDRELCLDGQGGWSLLDITHIE